MTFPGVVEERKDYGDGRHNFGIESPFTWSACLLVKDDNVILPEWLSYHYTTLPLRRIIIAVDPLSISQPDFILDKFRQIGINITKWTDRDFFYRGKGQWEDVAPPNASQEAIYKSHLYRQKLFLTSCVQTLKREGRSWTALIDTDEFLVFNRYEQEEGSPWDCTHKYSDVRVPNKTALDMCTSAYHAHMLTHSQHPRNLMPRPGTHNSTFAHYWEDHWSDLMAWHEWHNRPCIVLPRIQMQAQDSNESIVSMIPPGFNVNAFHTIRYRKHGDRQNKIPGKSILNVSGDFPREAFINNPHRVLSRAKCKGERIAKNSDSIFRVQHYTGSPEVFLSREGRRADQFDERNSHDVRGETFEAVGWLKAFVRGVGKRKARELTEGLREWAINEQKLRHSSMKKRIR